MESKVSLIGNYRKILLYLWVKIVFKMLYFGHFINFLWASVIFWREAESWGENYMLSFTSFLCAILHEWKNCLQPEHQQQRKEKQKVENKISKQENKWREVTEQGFVWLRGLGAKSRTKSYFKNSRDLFNSRPIKEEEN